MSKETRIGLLVGLLFIIMFGLVLANMLPKSDAPPVSPSPLGSAVNAPAEGDRDYGYIPPTPTMDSERRPVPAAPVALPVLLLESSPPPCSATAPAFTVIPPALPAPLVLVVMRPLSSVSDGVVTSICPALPVFVVELVITLPLEMVAVSPVVVIWIVPAFPVLVVLESSVALVARLRVPAFMVTLPPAPLPVLAADTIPLVLIVI